MRQSKTVDYQVLEPRQLLAIDIGANFSGAQLGTESNSVLSNVNGDIGPLNYVEVAEGAFIVHDRSTGTRVQQFSLDDFWLSAGAFIPNGNTTSDPKVIYDHQSERWFAASNGEGAGNWIYVAVSRTSDATGVWESSQFVGDSTGIHFNDDVTLSVDKDAVYLTTNNSGPFGDDSSIYSIPKSDLFLQNPTITNMSRFEGLDPGQYGSTIQVAVNFEDSDGKATAIARAGLGGVIVYDIVGADEAGATLTEPVFINTAVNVRDADFNAVAVDFPMVATQPNDETVIVNQDITGTVYEWKGSLWGVMSITSNFNLNPFPEIPDDGGEFRNGILWFEIDVNEKVLVEGERGPNANTIWSRPDSDEVREVFFNPSIAVNEYGILTIQYNSVARDLQEDPGVLGRGHYIGTTAVVGAATTGIDRRAVFHDDPVVLQPGLEDFAPNSGDVEFGELTAVRVDPLNPNSFWGISPFADLGDRWTTQITQMNPVDLAPYIEADNEDNMIVISPKPEDFSLMQVEIDGVVTDVLPYEVLGAPIIMGHGGADHFLMDYTLGDPITLGGLVLDGGFGTDVVETNDPNGGAYIVNEYDHPTFGDTYPQYLEYWISHPMPPWPMELPGDRPFPVADENFVLNTDGTYNDLSEFIDVEELWGGSGPDSFRFENGHMIGNALGFEGDDRFEFASDVIGDITGDLVPDWIGAILGSINGHQGFNTLDFTDSNVIASLEVLGVSEYDNGFDGKSLNPFFTSFMGPIGGDNDTDQWRNISYVRGSNNIDDSLQGMNAPTLVTLDDENSLYQADGGTMGFFHWENIYASEFVDYFNVISNTLNPVRLFGLEHNDHYRFSSDAPDYFGTTDNIGGLIFALGGEGRNTLTASNFAGSQTDILVLSQRISGMGEIVYNAFGENGVNGTFDLTIFTSQFDDFLRIHSFDQDNTMVVRSFRGDDLYSIEDLSKASVKIYGGNGDDTYVIERIQEVDFRNLEIFDSIDAEHDLVTLAGTILDELWVIDNQTFEDLTVAFEGIERFGIDGRGGDDTFHLQESIYELVLVGGDGDDVFNVSSDAPFNSGTVGGILKSVEIEAGTGTNALTIANPTGVGGTIDLGVDSIVGLLPAPLVFTAAGGNFAAIDNRLTGIRITGSDADGDEFNVTGLYEDNDLLISTLGGDDRIIIPAEVAGDVILDGGDDSDIYQISFVGGGNRQISISDFGLGGLNRAEFYGTDDDEVITVSNFEVERFDETVEMNGAFGFIGVESYAGNDQLSIANTLGAQNRLLAGPGNDTITISGTDNVDGLQLFGDEGNDVFYFLDIDPDTFTRGTGGDGDDVYIVRPSAFGDMVLDGEEDWDTYHIDLVGSGNRNVDTRDSGISGFDKTIITGTPTGDVIDIRAKRVFSAMERVVYDVDTERLEVHGENGPDTITLFSSLASQTQITSHFGLDYITIQSTGPTESIDIDLGSGDDTIVVKSTKSQSTTTIAGQEGDDTFHIGSTPENFGRLGRIRGPVSITGGENSFGGEDIIMVNDKGSLGSFGYHIGPGAIGWTSGPAADGNLLFAGISFDSAIEMARLDGTPFANRFDVTPSQDTRLFIHGNLPGSGEATKDTIYLHEAALHGANLTITDQAFGEGFWDFTDGSEIVEFSSIEAVFEV